MDLNASLSVSNESLPVRFTNIPAAVYVGVLMTVGTVGNLPVLYVYALRLRASPFNAFIFYMALFDCLVCVVGMPLDVANMLYPGHLPACKPIVVVGTATAVASGLVLISVAVLRYRAICKPLKPNISVRMARVISLLSLLVALATAWPAGVLVGNTRLLLSSGDMWVVNCDTEDRFEDTLLPLVYNGILFLIFFVSFSVLATVYGMIGRQLWRRKQLTPPPARASTNLKLPSVSVTDSSSAGLEVYIREGTEQSGTSYLSRRNTNRVNVPRRRPTFSRNHPTRGQKNCKMLFIVTVVFLLSYLPHLVLMILRALGMNFELTMLTESLVGIFIRSYYVNATVNPIIYGFCSNSFRAELRYMVRRFTRGRLPVGSRGRANLG